MFSTADEIPTETQNTVKKAFKTLKTHASSLNFTLQWQDLEDHFRRIHNSIQTKFQHHQNPKKLEAQIPLGSGKELLMYLISRGNDRDRIRDSVRDGLRNSGSASRVVIDAMGYFYRADGVELGLGWIRDVRWSCVYLLKEFVRAGVGVGDKEVREEARRVVREWKGRVKGGGVHLGLQIEGLCLLLIGFGLTGEVESEEIVGLLESVVHLKNIVDLFRGLGLGYMAADFVQKLIGQNKRLEAIRFIYEFELVEKIPPAPLIREHFDYIQMKENSKKVKTSHKAKNSEKVALKATLSIIEKYNIQCKVDFIMSRVEHLKRQKKKINAFEILGLPHQSGKKRGKKQGRRAPSVQSNQQFENKRHQAVGPSEVDVNGNIVASNTSLETHSSYHHPASSLPLQESRYFTLSARIPPPVSASQYSYAGYSMQQETQYKPPDLFTTESAECVSPRAGGVLLGATSSYYSMRRTQYDQEPYHTYHDREVVYPGQSRQQLTETPSSIHHNLTSPGDASHAGLLTSTSGLPSSALYGRYSNSSSLLYETSSLAIGSNDRPRHVRNHYSLGVAPNVNLTGSVHSSMGASLRSRKPDYYGRQI